MHTSTATLPPTQSASSLHTSPSRGPWRYQKPAQICAAPPLALRDRGPALADALLRCVHARLARLGLVARNASLRDIPAIESLVATRYDDVLRKETSPFDSYRFVLLGNVNVISTRAGELVACLYEVGYDDPARTSFFLRLIVDPRFEGLGLAKNISWYSSALAMRRGSLVRRALIDRENIKSHALHLNRLGFSYTSLVDEPLEGVGDHLVAEHSLDASRLLANAIDEPRLHARLRAGTLDFPHRVLRIEDARAIQHALRDGGRIIALLRPGALDEHAHFLCASPR